VIGQRLRRQLLPRHSQRSRPHGTEPGAAQRRVSRVQLRSHALGPLAVCAGRLWASVGYVRDGRQVPQLRRSVSVDRVSCVRKAISAQSVVSLAA
jgi:hypothetical protein